MKKSWFAQILFGIAAVSPMAAYCVEPSEYVRQAAQDPTIREMFARPLVLGASVSAYPSCSAPLRIAEAVGSQVSMIDHSVPGSRGSVEIESLKDEEIRAASIVLGVDIAFFDGLRFRCDRALGALDRLFDKVEEFGKPLVIANVPRFKWSKFSLMRPAALLPILDGQPCRAKLNEKIVARCKSAKSPCYLLDFESIYESESKAELKAGSVDGLHPTRASSERTAARILRLILESNEVSNGGPTS